MHHIRFNKGWLPREIVVETSTSDVPFSYTEDQPSNASGHETGNRGQALIERDGAKAQFTTTTLETVNAVNVANEAPEKTREPLEAVLAALHEKQCASFTRLWKRVPPHLHEIQFDFDKALWKGTGDDTLEDTIKKWGDVLLHAIATHNNNVSNATGLAPNEVHIWRYTRLRMTILESRGVKGHQCEKSDNLDYLCLTRDRQVREYNLVKEEDRLTKAKQQAANDEIDKITNN